jgi:phosphoribosylglycinamide formyltransferase-1
VQEHVIYPLCVEWFATGRLALRDGVPWLDGVPLDAPVVLDGTRD